MNDRRTKTCQALALASAVGIAGCGGGGAGTKPDSGGEVVRPNSEITSPYRAWEANPNALDIAEHWRDPNLIGDALGIDADTEAGTAGLAAARAGAKPAGNTSRTILRNVAPASIAPMGTSNGVTVGHWRDGPAGTMDIDFDWRAFPHASAEERAVMERAGREWSRRIATNVASGTIEAGTTIRFEEGLGDQPPPKGTAVIDETIMADDSYIIFLFDGGEGSEQRSRGGQDRQYEDGVRVRVYGRVATARRHATSRQVATHEVGHAIGIASFRSTRSPAHDYFDAQSHTFNGPNAMRANGGQPVPLQWLDVERNPVAPRTPGATRDGAHLGVCTSVMAYCSRAQGIKGPQEIDFAVLEDLGYTLLDADEAAEPEVYGFGAWGRYSAWGTGVERQIDHETGADHTRANADAFGVEPPEAFAETIIEAVGSASWSGNLIGVDRSTPDLAPVVGSATLELELETLHGEARFEGLTTVRDGETAMFRHSALNYRVSLDENAFTDADGRVAGALYGPGHEEMAGVLDDDRSDVELLGAFGGTMLGHPSGLGLHQEAAP